MPDTVTNDDARYAFDIVEAICTEVGPGLPGSAQERERAAFLEKELEAHLGAGNVTVEEFTVAPGACLGSFPISALCVLVAAMLNVSTGHLTGISPRVTATAALAFSIIAASLFVLEFVLSIEVVDPLFGKKRSVNVIGTLRRPGSGAVKRLLMVSGHHDSAPANTWLALLGYGAVIVGVFFTHGRTGGGIVPGAVDNLAASALAVALSRFLVMHPADIPADTEVRFVSFGSEEAGLRGSRRYVERHRDELRRLDARLLNFETVAHPEIAILTSDVNGTVRNAPEMVTSVVAAAERAGVPYKVKSAVPGVATDAGPFSRAGLKAATLLPFRMPRQLVAFYHQKGDGPAVLTAEPLSNVLKLAVEWIRAGGD